MTFAAKSMRTPGPISLLLRSRVFGVLARVVLTLPYWWSGVTKLADLHGALAEAAHFGLKPAWLVVAATVIVQLGGSLLLILGRIGWLAAGALGVFTALASLIAHPCWTITDPVERFHALNTFLEHIGMIGGFMLAAILVEQEKAT
jgi:transmembrane protein